jgi:hypothetical protein
MCAGHMTVASVQKRYPKPKTRSATNPTSWDLFLELPGGAIILPKSSRAADEARTDLTWSIGAPATCGGESGQTGRHRVRNRWFPAAELRRSPMDQFLWYAGPGGMVMVPCVLWYMLRNGSVDPVRVVGGAAALSLLVGYVVQQISRVLLEPLIRRSLSRAVASSGSVELPRGDPEEALRTWEVAIFNTAKETFVAQYARASRMCATLQGFTVGSLLGLLALAVASIDLRGHDQWVLLLACQLLEVPFVFSLQQARRTQDLACARAKIHTKVNHKSITNWLAHGNPIEDKDPHAQQGSEAEMKKCIGEPIGGWHGWQAHCWRC